MCTRRVGVGRRTTECAEVAVRDERRPFAADADNACGICFAPRWSGQSQLDEGLAGVERVREGRLGKDRSAGPVSGIDPGRGSVRQL